MKKVCALVLIMIMCMTMLMAVPFTAQAAPTAYKDTFDGLDTGILAGSVIAESTQIFPKNIFYAEGAALEIVEDGFNGGKALKVTENGPGRTQLQTASFAPTASNPVYVNFKFKYLEDKGSRLHIAVGYDTTVLFRTESDKNVIYMPSRSNGAYLYETDEWYDFTFKFCDGNRVEITVVNENGDVCTGVSTSSSKFLNIQSAYTNEEAVAGVSFLLDDFTVFHGNQTDKLNLVSTNYGSIPEEPVSKDIVVNENFNDSTIYNLHYYMGMTAGNGKFIDVGLWTNDYITFQMVDDCNGGYAPAITPVAGRTPWWQTVSVSYDDCKAFVSTKFKVINDYSNTGTSTAIAQFAFGKADGNDENSYELMVRDGKFETWQYWGRQKASYIPEVWYTIVYEFETVNSVKQVKLYIYDDNGNAILTADPANKLGNPLNEVADAKIEMTAYKPAAGAEPTFAIDDVNIIKTTAEDSEAFIKSEILGIIPEVNDTVYTTKPVVKLGFDQAVASDSVAVFKANGKADVAGVIRNAGTPFVEIIPERPLDYDTSYVLDLSGIKGLNEQGMAEASAQSISFKTAPYSMGTMTVGEDVIADGKLTVPVTFTNENVDELNATVIAALFSGENSDKLVWAQTKNIVAGNMGKNDLTFTNLPENADTMELKVFAWDNFDSLKPLYK